MPADLTRPPVRAVVIGGGTMGAGIAAALLRAGSIVDLVEVDDSAADRAGERLRALLKDSVRRDRLTAGALVKAIGRLHEHRGQLGVAPVPDVVIESVPERLELKRGVLREAEELQPLLLASNTSAISIDALARDLRAPERFIGLHFFNPVSAMALVEVVIGSSTSASSVAAATRLVAMLDKEAVQVADSPGFATSRLGVLLGLEAIRMVEEKVASPEAIDRAMQLGYRHPIGPLRLTDIVGLDVRLDIATQLAGVYGPRFQPPPLLRQMVGEGRLGRKSGRGFYTW